MPVGVNAPKSPVTEGSLSIAAATMPNVCKMPGPPAPFVPTPLPNIGKSDNSPTGYSKSVKIESNAVAIQGATFNSMGDVASQGTGGGVVSNNVQGPTAFLGPGSFDVAIEGKNVQFLGDQMLNNCGPSGSPANSATMSGVVHAPASPETLLQEIVDDCDKTVPPTHQQGPRKGQKKSCTKLGADKHACCEKALQDHRAKNPPSGKPPVEGEQGYKRPPLDADGNAAMNPDGSYPAPQPTGGPRPNLAAAFAQGGRAIRAAFAAMKGNCYPDAAILNADGSKRFVDFKFPCPEGHPSGKGTSKGGVKTSMGKIQQNSYDSLSYGSGSPVGALSVSPR